MLSCDIPISCGQNVIIYIREHLYPHGVHVCIEIKFTVDHLSIIPGIFLLLFVGVFLCLNFFVGRFCAVTFLVCVEFEVLLMPYSVVLGLSPFTVCLVLAGSLSRAAAAISF